MSRIFTEQKSNLNSDPYLRFFALIFAFEFMNNEQGLF